jgi:UDP-N-acetyl-D-glucosamine dehydrogenase
MDTELNLPLSESWASSLEDGLRRRTAAIAVVGLGYVGLPMLVAASKAGFPVIGLDVDQGKLDAIRAGSSYVVDVVDRDIAGLERARFTSNHVALSEADVIVIAVPTPLTDGTPDLSLVKRASQDVAGSLLSGRLVVLESTTYPGTTEEVVRPILERSGLTAGTDFALAYSPERIDPGSSWPLEEIPKIVAGFTPKDEDLAERLYAELGFRTVRVPSMRVAEMAKLVENTFRQVNIALVNELATIAREIGVDIWAAIEAAATKPFGYMPFWPGPGVGGHCIAVDPSYLSWRVGQRLGFGIGFVEHAKEVNKRMPAYVAGRIGEALNDAGKPMRGSRIMAVGLAYKAGVNDVRESPAVEVLERLARAGSICSYHDPYVPAATLSGKLLRSQPLDDQVLAAQDCVAILTAHPGVDYEAIVLAAQLVFDATGVTRPAEAPSLIRL